MPTDPNTFRESFVVLAQYLMTKEEADAQATVELLDGMVLWVQRTGLTDGFQCAVLESDTARQAHLMSRYIERGLIGEVYSKDFVEIYESIQNITLPALLKFYILNISKDKIDLVDVEEEEANQCVTKECIDKKWVENMEDVLNGTIPFGEDFIIIHGLGYGHVLVKEGSGSGGYAILTLWEALYRPFHPA